MTSRDRDARALTQLRTKGDFVTTPLIDSIIRRVSLFRLLLGAACVAALVVAGLLAADYLRGFVNGPQKMTVSELQALGPLEGLEVYYVTVTGDDAYDSGFEYVTTRSTGSETVDYSFPLLILEESVLLVKNPGPLGDFIPQIYTGALLPIPAEIEREVITPLTQQVGDLRAALLPFMLDASNYRRSGYIGLAVAAVVLLLALWLLITGARTMSNPEAHAIFKRLARYGTPKSVGTQIEMELKSEHTVLHKKAHFLRSWMVQKTNTSFDAVRYDDVAWFYKHILRNKSYGITVSKVYSAYVLDRHGVKVAIVSRKEQHIDEILQALYAQVPWAVAGYSEEVNKAWNKDRVSFLAAVDLRRKQYAAQASRPQA